MSETEGTKVVIGEYDREGYSIMTAGGDVLYEAGANARDSQASGRDVPLRTVRSWCARTGREIADERGAVWGGAGRAEDGE